MGRTIIVGAGINGLLLLIEVAATTGRTVFLDVPAAIGVRDYMM